MIKQLQSTTPHTEGRGTRTEEAERALGSVGRRCSVSIVTRQLINTLNSFYKDLDVSIFAPLIRIYRINDRKVKETETWIRWVRIGSDKEKNMDIRPMWPSECGDSPDVSGISRTALSGVLTLTVERTVTWGSAHLAGIGRIPRVPRLVGLVQGHGFKGHHIFRGSLGARLGRQRSGHQFCRGKKSLNLKGNKHLYSPGQL